MSTSTKIEVCRNVVRFHSTTCKNFYIHRYTNIPKIFTVHDQAIRHTDASILSFVKCLWNSRTSCQTQTFHTYSLKINRSFISTSSNCNKEHRKCWKCGNETNLKTELYFCKCGVVQSAAPELTYFQLFDLEISFDIEVKVLSEKFIELQKRLHPDKFSQSSKNEREHAEEQSSLINKGYSVLLKPLSRAIYLLQIHNKPVQESSALSDTDFLEEIMDINENIADAASPEELKQIEEDNVSKIKMCIQDVSKAFRDNDIDSAHNIVVRYQYYANITEKIKELHRMWIS